MRIVKTITQLRDSLKPQRLAGLSIAFVPTMGNLHAGHIALVKAAKNQADVVVVSIFVNPTQFGPGEDFDTYPRTEYEDQQQLIASGADFLFLPAVTDIYAADAKTTVSVAGLSKRYCGEYRPGHFDGVATVVNKLFNIVQPDIALFGLKDFQQLTVIRTMVRDLDIPIEILGVATVREASGLALSSRNAYLTPKEKIIAAKLYQALCNARDAVLSGQCFVKIEHEALDFLKTSGFVPDYFSLCRASDLEKPSEQDRELVLLAAARLGKTRLIDNMCISR